MAAEQLPRLTVTIKTAKCSKCGKEVAPDELKALPPPYPSESKLCDDCHPSFEKSCRIYNHLPEQEPRTRPLRLIDVQASVQEEALVLVPDDGSSLYYTLSHTWLDNLYNAIKDVAAGQLRLDESSYNHEAVVRSYTKEMAQRPPVKGWARAADDIVADDLRGILKLLGILAVARVRHLWADFVCINQADNDELRASLSTMGQLYAASTANIILVEGLSFHGMNGGSVPPRWFGRGWTLQEYLLAPHNIYLVRQHGPCDDYRDDMTWRGGRVFADIKSESLSQAAIAVIKHGLPGSCRSTARVRVAGYSNSEVFSRTACCYHPCVCEAGDECLEHAGGDCAPLSFHPPEMPPYAFHLAYSTEAALLGLGRQPPCNCFDDPCGRFILVGSDSLQAYIGCEQAAGFFGSAHTKQYAGHTINKFEAVRRLLAAHAGTRCGSLSLLEANRLYGEREVSVPVDRVFSILGLAALPDMPSDVLDNTHLASGENTQAVEQLWAWALQHAMAKDCRSLTAHMALDFGGSASSAGRFSALPHYMGGKHVLPTLPHMGGLQLVFREGWVSDGGIEGDYPTCEVTGLRCDWNLGGGWFRPPEGTYKANLLLPHTHDSDTSPLLLQCGTLWKTEELPPGRMAGSVNSTAMRVTEAEQRQKINATLVLITEPSSIHPDVLLVCQPAIGAGPPGRLAKIGLLFANIAPLPWSVPRRVCIGGQSQEL